MDKVIDDHDPIIITRNIEQSVVLLSLEDYQALEETAFLLRTPANATRLLASIAQLNAGKGQIKGIARTPFSGIGKPEPLKHALKGYWSRRINDEHRIVYSVSGDQVMLAQIRSHY